MAMFANHGHPEDCICEVCVSCHIQKFEFDTLAHKFSSLRDQIEKLNHEIRRQDILIRSAENRINSQRGTGWDEIIKLTNQNAKQYQALERIAGIAKLHAFSFNELAAKIYETALDVLGKDWIDTV